MKLNVIYVLNVVCTHARASLMAYVAAARPLQRTPAAAVGALSPAQHAAAQLL